MGWEYRGDRLYYYRKSRNGQKVISEYVGAGETAELIYLLESSDQTERENERRAWKKKKDDIRVIDVQIEQLNNILRNFVIATLLTSGYHPHKGQWRRNRNVK